MMARVELRIRRRDEVEAFVFVSELDHHSTSSCIRVVKYPRDIRKLKSGITGNLVVDLGHPPGNQTIETRHTLHPMQVMGAGTAARTRQIIAR